MEGVSEKGGANWFLPLKTSNSPIIRSTISQYDRIIKNLPRISKVCDTVTGVSNVDMEHVYSP